MFIRRGHQEGAVSRIKMVHYMRGYCSFIHWLTSLHVGEINALKLLISVTTAHFSVLGLKAEERKVDILMISRIKLI